jgi:hypothetical protein
MNSTTLGFWRIFAKTLGSLLSNFDSTRAAGSQQRQYFLIVFLGFTIMFAFFGYDDYIDYRIPFPSLREMTLSEGNLTRVKKGKVLHFQLTTNQGEKILFAGNLTHESGLFYNKETKEWLSHPATVRWFQFPSGERGMMEVWVEGTQYRDMQETIKRFNDGKNNHTFITLALISIGICLLLFIFEFIYVKKILTMEANNGN